VAAGAAVKQRLDVFLTAELDPMSRAKVQSLIKDGHVQVNGLTEIRTKCVFGKIHPARLGLPLSNLGFATMLGFARKGFPSALNYDNST
jgi:hypothetical protein